MNPISTLERVAIYHAPAGRNPRPMTIPEGTELIEILTGGTLFFEEDGEERMYTKGTIFWHIAGEETISRSPPDDPYRCFVASFRVAEKHRKLPRVTFWDDLSELDELIDESLRRFHDESVSPVIFGQYLYARIFWAAYEHDRRRSVSALPEALLRSLELLRNQPRVPSIREMAAAARVSEPNLYVLFQRHLHVTPHQYCLRHRLRRARRLLAGSALSIKLLAEECGFEHIESFYRAFRRHCGTTPQEYRKQQQLSSPPRELTPQDF